MTSKWVLLLKLEGARPFLIPQVVDCPLGKYSQHLQPSQDTVGKLVNKTRARIELCWISGGYIELLDALGNQRL